MRKNIKPTTDLYHIMLDGVYRKLVAHIMEHVEALGLPYAQEQAVKSNMRREFHYVQNELTYYLPAEIFDEMLKDGLPTGSVVKVK